MRPRTLSTNQAALLLGVSTNTLRGWERRYGWPKPARSDAGQRMYAHEEVAALLAALHQGLPTPVAVDQARESLNTKKAAAGADQGPAISPRRVFLCHSSADKTKVRNLYRRLDQDGVAPWLDDENLVAGEDWELEIGRAVRASDVVVVCLSKAATTRAGYVHKEIKLALDVADYQPEGAIFVIPARLEECVVPERLSRLHRVDLFKDGGYERLIQAVHRTPHSGAS